jgi:hypothetical protein
LEEGGNHERTSPVVKTQSKTSIRDPRLSKFEERSEMRLTTGMRMVPRFKWIVLSMLAGGAMLITVTTFTYYELRGGEAASPSSGIGLPASSNNPIAEEMAAYAEEMADGIR